MIKIIKYFLEACFVYLFFLIAKVIGIRFGRKLFAFIFQNIGPIFKSNEIINRNLSRFSNKLSKEEKNKITSNMWSNYGMTFVEYIYLEKFRKSNSHINMEGKTILDEISRNKKPVIFVSGHFANFELMSMEITKKKISLATIYRPLNNIFINPLMEYLRKKYVCQNQIKKGLMGVKDSIKFLNDGTSIALMIDQRVSEGEKVKFFNEDALTTTLPAQLALKFDLDIVPVFIKRDNKNIFNIYVDKPVKINNFKNKLVLSEYLNKILENMIKKNPDQWIWTHDRWK